MNIQLIYHSVAKPTTNEEQLENILKTARDFNKRNNITGCLLHHNSEFLQILEGESDIISSLYERIKADQRHSHVTSLYNKEFKVRIFNNWNMGYGRLLENDMDTIAKSLDILEIKSLDQKSSESQDLIAYKIFTAISNNIINMPIDS